MFAPFATSAARDNMKPIDDTGSPLLLMYNVRDIVLSHLFERYAHVFGHRRVIYRDRTACLDSLTPRIASA